MKNRFREQGNPRARLLRKQNDKQPMSNAIITSLLSLLRRTIPWLSLRGRRLPHDHADLTREGDRPSRLSPAPVFAGPDGNLSHASAPLTQASETLSDPCPPPDRTMLLWLSRCFLFVSLLLPGSNMASHCSGACYAATNTLITLHFFRRCYESGKPSSGMVKCFSRQLRSVALIRFIHASRSAAPPGRLKRFRHDHHSGKKKRSQVRPPFRADPEPEQPVRASPAEPSLFSPDTLLRQHPLPLSSPCTGRQYQETPSGVSPPLNMPATSTGCVP